MKKTFLIVIILLVGIIGTAYWHSYEQKEWFKWKQNQLNIVEKVKANQEIRGWSNTEASFYSSKLADSLGAKPPFPCPYCFVKSLNR